MANYVNRVIVGKAAGTANTGATLAAITRGDIIVLGENMTVLADAAAEQPIYLAVGTGVRVGDFILSHKIYPGANLVVNNQKTVAAAEQVTSFASIDVPTIGDSYQAILAFKDRQRLIANRQTRLVLDAIATTTNPYDVAALLEQQSRFSSPHSDPYGVVVDITATGTIPGVTDNDAAVVQGSNVVTFATAATHSVGTDIAVGDILAFDDIDYKVTAVNGLALTLDRPFRAASEAVFPKADLDVKQTITAAGMTFTAVAPPFNNSAVDIYEKVEFELGGSANMGAVTKTTASQLGQGVYEQVKAAEFASQGMLGNSNLRDWPIHAFDYHAVSGTTYDVINITSQDVHEGDLQGQMSSPVGLTIAFSTSGSSAQRDAVDAILEDALGISALSWA